MSKLLIFTDGAARGNPGPAGLGVVITDPEGNTLSEVAEHIGETTNNVAEYTALIRGLEEALKMGGTEVEIHTDSELMARQLTGVYKVRAEHLVPLVQKVRELLRQFRRISISHIMRGANKRADALARKASQSVKASQNTN